MYFKCCYLVDSLVYVVAVRNIDTLFPIFICIIMNVPIVSNKIREGVQ